MSSGHNGVVTPALRPLLFGVVLVTSLVVTGCGSSQKDLACPGERCTPELVAVRERVARLAGVTEVRSVVYQDTLITGRRGLVVYRATPGSAAEARELNRSVLALYREGSPELAGAGDVDLQLVWDPEALVPRTDDLGRPGVNTPDPGSVAPCLATRCRTALRAIARKVRAALPSDGFTFAGVRLHRRGTGGVPEVVVRLATVLRMTDYDRIGQVADQVSTITASSGIPTAYGKRVLVTHPVERTMLTRWTSFGGFTDVPDQQAIGHRPLSRPTQTG